jgi:hypothetical protein
MPHSSLGKQTSLRHSNNRGSTCAERVPNLINTFKLGKTSILKLATGQAHKTFRAHTVMFSFLMLKFSNPALGGSLHRSQRTLRNTHCSRPLYVSVPVKHTREFEQNLKLSTQGYKATQYGIGWHGHITGMKENKSQRF